MEKMITTDSVVSIVARITSKRLKSIYQTSGLETASSVNGAIEQYTYTFTTIYKCLLTNSFNM